MLTAENLNFGGITNASNSVDWDQIERFLMRLILCFVDNYSEERQLWSDTDGVYWFRGYSKGVCAALTIEDTKKAVVVFTKHRGGCQAVLML